MAKGTTKAMTSLPSSSLILFFDVFNKAKAAAKTEEAWKGDACHRLPPLT